MSERLPRLPRLKGEQRPPRLPKLPVVFATGPNVLGLRRRPGSVNGPGDPPYGFVGATTSLDEWFIYFACAKVFNDPEDPRKPPFFGGADWGYQIGTGAFTRERGSAVIDFLFYFNNERVALRIQTPYFHDRIDAAQQGYDLLQIIYLQKEGFRVQDVYSQDFVGDKSGQAAIIVVKEAIGRIQRPSTITSTRSTVRA